MRMKVLTMMLAGFVTAAAAMAQAPMGAMPGPMPAGPAAEVQRSYAAVKKNILKSADEMPAADFGYKPEPDIRTYARVINHISEAQLHSCGAVNGTAPDALAKVPAETADKAAILVALNASFAECDKAYGSATDTNMTAMMIMGKMSRSRMGFLWGNVSHDNEQYATLALYLRLKGLAPPSTEK